MVKFSATLIQPPNSVVVEPPEGYKTNSKKESLLLNYAENFHRQFRQLYGDRKALFLKPKNENGVEVNDPD